MRRSEAILLIVLVTLAGCAAPTADVVPSDIPVDAGVAVVSRGATATSNTTGNASLPSAIPLVPPTRIPFAEPVALPMTDGYGGGEPNIAALPDGTLFVVSPTGGAETGATQGGGYLWRSQDRGETWEMLRGPTGSAPIGVFCSCDSDVVTSPDGWVYYTDWWISAFFGPGNYLVERSSDGGDTWDAAPITTREALANSVDRQWLVAGPDGFVALFYSYYGISTPFVGVSPPVDLPLADARPGVHVVVSHDHGETWSDPRIVVDGGDWQIAHARLTPDGTLVMPYGLVDTQDSFWRDPSTVMLAISKDEGVSWEHVEVAQVPEGFDNLWAVQADVDQSGAIHVAWAARVDDDIMATYVATSRDGGATWTEPLALRAEGLNFLPWVTTFGNSTVAVGWYGGNATGDPTEADDAWYAYVAESADGGDTYVVHRVTETPVKADGSLCPKGAACQGDRELLDYAGMVYDADGLLHYAFARSEDGTAMTMVASEIGAMA